MTERILLTSGAIYEPGVSHGTGYTGIADFAAAPTPINYTSDSFGFALDTKSSVAGYSGDSYIERFKKTLEETTLDGTTQRTGPDKYKAITAPKALSELITDQNELAEIIDLLGQAKFYGSGIEDTDTNSTKTAKLVIKSRILDLLRKYAGQDNFDEILAAIDHHHKTHSTNSTDNIIQKTFEGMFASMGDIEVIKRNEEGLPYKNGEVVKKDKLKDYKDEDLDKVKFSDIPDAERSRYLKDIKERVRALIADAQISLASKKTEVETAAKESENFNPLGIETPVSRSTARHVTSVAITNAGAYNVARLRLLNESKVIDATVDVVDKILPVGGKLEQAGKTVIGEIIQGKQSISALSLTGEGAEAAKAAVQKAAVTKGSGVLGCLFAESAWAGKLAAGASWGTKMGIARGAGIWGARLLGLTNPIGLAINGAFLAYELYSACKEIQEDGGIAKSDSWLASCARGADWCASGLGFGRMFT